MRIWKLWGIGFNNQIFSTMILAADLIVYANKLIKLSYDKGICDIDYFIAFKFTMLIGVNVCICVYLNKLSPLPCVPHH